MHRFHHAAGAVLLLIALVFAVCGAAAPGTAVSLLYEPAGSAKEDVVFSVWPVIIPDDTAVPNAREAMKLYSQIRKADTAPIQSKATDSSGCVQFDVLENGTYLFAGTSHTQKDIAYIPAPFVLRLDGTPIHSICKWTAIQVKPAVHDPAPAPTTSREVTPTPVPGAVSHLPSPSAKPKDTTPGTASPVPTTSPPDTDPAPETQDSTSFLFPAFVFCTAGWGLFVRRRRQQAAKKH